jgi:hypothetical protein
MLLLSGLPPARAATFDAAEGDVDGLIAAINVANGSGAPATIVLSESVYVLNGPDNHTFGPTGLPVITGTITIEGNGATVRRAQDAAGFRIFAVVPEAQLELKDLTVSHGHSVASSPTGIGGGILTYGALILTRSAVSGNEASHVGGGIAVGGNGTVVRSKSTVNGNVAGVDGGGIYNPTSFGGSVLLNRSTACGNTAVTGDGGGIFNQRYANVYYSTISDNVAGGGGGGIYNRGTLVVTEDDQTAIAANLEVFNSTISDNTAGGAGGGINNDSHGVLEVTFSTVSRNLASQRGGGIQHGFATTQLTATIVAGNTVSSVEDYECAGVNLVRGTDVCGSVSSDGGYNLIGDGQGMAGLSVANGNQIDVDPVLDPAGLKDNSGTTRTIALRPGSPAIDAVAVNNGPNCLNSADQMIEDPTTGLAVAIDQRGEERPQGDQCDIGAFEFGPGDEPEPGADELLAELVTEVGDMNAPTGTKQSIISSLTAARTSLAAGDETAGCNQLKAAVNKVTAQRGKHLSTEQADALLADINEIRATLGC